ncbi:MAG: hypothetical protein V2A79_14850 [Planctomycetota bacterium]
MNQCEVDIDLLRQIINDPDVRAVLAGEHDWPIAIDQDGDLHLDTHDGYLRWLVGRRYARSQVVGLMIAWLDSRGVCVIWDFGTPGSWYILKDCKTHRAVWTASGWDTFVIAAATHFPARLPAAYAACKALIAEEKATKQEPEKNRWFDAKARNIELVAERDAALSARDAMDRNARKLHKDDKARIAELEAIVGKLPKTQDGVAVAPGMEVYCGMLGETLLVKGDIYVQRDGHKLKWRHIHSSFEAALAAMKEKDHNGR